MPAAYLVFLAATCSGSFNLQEEEGTHGEMEKARPLNDLPEPEAIGKWEIKSEGAG